MRDARMHGTLPFAVNQISHRKNGVRRYYPKALPKLPRRPVRMSIEKWCECLSARAEDGIYNEEETAELMNAIDQWMTYIQSGQEER